MTLTNEEIKICYFRFMNDETSLKDFEQWIYATPEIENYVGEAGYFELVSFDFRQSGAKYEFSKIINKYISSSEFYAWQLRQTLQNLLVDGVHPADVFKKLYDLYNGKGYYFFGDIGLLYLMYSFDREPSLMDEKEQQNFRETLEKYLPIAIKEIEVVLDALNSGDLKIISYGEDGYQTEYQLDRDVQERLKLLDAQIVQVRNETSRTPKKWWQFWK